MKAEPPPPVILVDTREQRPWAFDGALVAERFGTFPTKAATLDTGDYSVETLEERVRIERKNLQDFVQSVTSGRERFWRELERLAPYAVKAVIVEGSLAEVEMMGAGSRVRSQARPQAVVASATAIWVDFGIPVVWAGHRAMAEYTAAWSLRRVWLRHLHEKGQLE